MKIKHDLGLVLLGAALLLGLSSCDERIDYREDLSLPKEVVKDFNSRYPLTLVTIQRTAYDDTDHSSYIFFTDEYDLSCTTIYVEDKWMFTEKQYDKDNFLSQLPRTVSTAFKDLGIPSPYLDTDNSFVSEVRRSGIRHPMYEFCFLEPMIEEGELVFETHDVVISDDGEVLKHSYSPFNRAVWWYNVETCLSQVKERFPEGNIMGTVNVSGNNVFLVKDDGYLKEVTYRNLQNWTWTETRYRLPDDTHLPDYILAEYESYRQQKPEFVYDSVFRVEDMDGNYYSLRCGDDKEYSMVFFRIR